MVPTKIPGLYTFQTLAHMSKKHTAISQRFLRNEVPSLQPWGLNNLSGMSSELSHSAWFSSSRLVSPPRALGLCMCQMRILWFHVKPSVRKAYIFKEYMYENKSLFFYTLEIFSFGGVECRKSKNLLERLSRGFQGVYSWRIITTNLHKSSAIFIRYPIINSLASDRLPIFLPINRHSQPNKKPLGVSLKRIK